MVQYNAEKEVLKMSVSMYTYCFRCVDPGLVQKLLVGFCFNSHKTCALGQSKFMKSYIENSSKSTLIFVKNLKKFDSLTFF